jgi:hypothetical protein
MGSKIKSLARLLAFVPVMGCEADSTQVHENTEVSSQYEFSSKEPSPLPTPDLEHSDFEENVDATGKKQEAKEVDEWWMALPWKKAVKPLLFDKDGTPMPMSLHPRSYYRIAGKTKETTKEVHRQIAIAVGLRASEEHVPKLARFLSTRSSIETSMQGNQRPFDTRGSVHSLDVKAAYRAGIRSRDKYIEAGNELAKDTPWIFLGYGQGGMISWFFLDDWDIKGDPRMLGDSVIGGLTYRRALVSAYNSQKNSKIRCFEYDNEGRAKTLFFNGKNYRVGKVAIDADKYQACMDEGPKSRAEKKSEDKLVARCEHDSRKTYKWKPGAPQPENTVPIPEITWWQLKRAAGGQACPPWKGDTYYKHTKAKHAKRAAAFDLDLTGVVRRRDLGHEPEGVNQYDLWKSIWDSVVESLGDKPINWENLSTIGSEEPVYVGPSPEKIEQERRRARGEDIDPFKQRNKKKPS